MNFYHLMYVYILSHNVSQIFRKDDQEKKIPNQTGPYLAPCGSGRLSRPCKQTARSANWKLDRANNWETVQGAPVQQVTSVRHMPALTRLAAPPPLAAPSARRRSLTLPPPPRPPHCSSSWYSGRCSPSRPSATAGGVPRGGPLPEPEELDQLLLTALRAARIRDEESRRSGIPNEFSHIGDLVLLLDWLFDLG